MIREIMMNISYIRAKRRKAFDRFFVMLELLTKEQEQLSVGDILLDEKSKKGVFNLEEGEFIDLVNKRQELGIEQFSKYIINFINERLGATDESNEFSEKHKIFMEIANREEL